MNENAIMDMMDEIEYGWIDKYDKKHVNDFETFSDEYMLQTPQQVIKNKIGVCWDQVELERYYFSNINRLVKTFFIVHYDNDKCPTHTFLTFEKEGKFYWFEHSWKVFKGIHKYDSILELLIDVRNKFIQLELNNKFKGESLIIHEYSKPKFNISTQEFYNHCEHGKYIDLGVISF